MLTILALVTAQFTPVATVPMSCAENVRGREGRARVEVVVGAGALHEGDDRGAAHLLEHLLLRRLGLDHNNGATTWDATRYFSDVRASELSTAAVDLVRAVRDANFTEDDVAIEKRIVTRELDERDPGYAPTLRDSLFRNTRFDRPLGGTEATVRGTTIDALKAFHATHYVKGNIAVIVAGAIGCGAIRARLEPELERFADGKATAAPVESSAEPGAQSVPGGGSAFLGGFYWYDAHPRDEFVMRIVAKHLHKSALATLREKLGVTYSPQAHFVRQGGAGYIAIHVVTENDASVVQSWFDDTTEALRDTREPRVTLADAIEALRRELDFPDDRDALAAIRHEPSPQEILTSLDDHTLVSAMERMLASDRRFATSGGGAGELIVLGLFGLGVLAFLAWLGRSLMRGQA